MHYKVLAANRINLDTIDGGGYSSIRILSKRETSPKNQKPNCRKENGRVNHSW